MGVRGAALRPQLPWWHTTIGSGDGTDFTPVVTLTQSNNSSQEAADSMADKGWRPVLDGLKQVVEAES